MKRVDAAPRQMGYCCRIFTPAQPDIAGRFNEGFLIRRLQGSTGRGPSFSALRVFAKERAGRCLIPPPPRSSTRRALKHERS